MPEYKHVPNPKLTNFSEADDLASREHIMQFSDNELRWALWCLANIAVGQPAIVALLTGASPKNKKSVDAFECLMQLLCGSNADELIKELRKQLKAKQKQEAAKKAASDN